MPTFNTPTFGDFVELAPKIWIKEYEDLDMSARKSGMFNERPWAAGTGDSKEYKEFDTNQYASNKAEGDQAKQSQLQVGYSKFAGLVRRAENVSITWEMRQRNKYDSAINQIKALPEKIAGRMDLDLSHRITFGHATSYVDMDGATIDTSTGDGLALFATAHTLKGTATTYRNSLSGNAALSQTSLEALEKQAVENTLDHFGTKRAGNFDLLFTTDNPATVNMARKILQSTADISANSNNGVINVYQGRFKHVILPRVATDANGAVDSSKATYWGIASSRNTSAYLEIEQEPTMLMPSLAPGLSFDNAEDVGTDDVTIRGRGSYSICIVGARWIHASKGDAS